MTTARAPLPARRLTVPEGYVITSEEIARLIEAANTRVASGEPGISADVAAETPTLYTFFMPVGVSLSREDAIAILTLANRACESGDADLLVTWSGGHTVKRWITLKSLDQRDDGAAMLRLGGVKVKEF